MDLVLELAAAIDHIWSGQDRVLVGIDGPDAAGKTTLAARLAAEIPGAIQASIDRFENPTEIRIKHGRGGDTYYRDGFDFATLRRETLAPFVAGASRMMTSHRDPQTDQLAISYAEPAARAVLVVDGVFLQRPELHDLWSLVIYLKVSPETSLDRARVRDLAWNPSVEAVEAGYNIRYLPGQALYRADRNPESSADYLIDNTDPAAPIVLRQPRW